MKIDSIGFTWHCTVWSDAHGDSKSCVNGAFRLASILATNGSLMAKVSFETVKLFETLAKEVPFSPAYARRAEAIKHLSRKKLNSEEKAGFREMIDENLIEEATQEVEQTAETIIAVETAMRVYVFCFPSTNPIEIPQGEIAVVEKGNKTQKKIRPPGLAP